MIVDSHAHIFPPLGGPSGFAPRRDHTRYLQHQMAGHHMPTRRAADNAITSGETLLVELLIPIFQGAIWEDDMEKICGGNVTRLFAA